MPITSQLSFVMIQTKERWADRNAGQSAVAERECWSLYKISKSACILCLDYVRLQQRAEKHISV